MNKIELKEIIENPTNYTLHYYNHVMYNVIIVVDDFGDFRNTLEESEWEFLGFQKLDEELTKVRGWGIYDYALVFTDAQSEEKLWLHVDSDFIYKAISWLDITEEEKTELKKLYPKTREPRKDDEDSFDFSSLMGGRF